MEGHHGRKVCEILKFDDRFDEVLAKDVDQSQRMIGERTSEFLSWRFKDVHSKISNIRIFYGTGSCLLGYAGGFIDHNQVIVVDM